MPTFQGLVTEENVVQLIEYIKSLGVRPGGPGIHNRARRRPPVAVARPSNR